jgi:DNA-binding XRE family transcriptional regulator
MSADGNTLAHELDEMEDQRDALTAMLARIKSANDEVLPWALVKRLSGGEVPLRAWREHRGLTEGALAEISGVEHLVIAAIEMTHREPQLRDAVALARALKIDAEDLLPWRQD